jgi:hypothetical protein
VTVKLSGRSAAGRVVGLLDASRGFGLLAGPVLAAGMAERLGPARPIVLAAPLACAGTGLLAPIRVPDGGGGS